jgi:hypothetical protein
MIRSCASAFSFSLIAGLLIFAPENADGQSRYFSLAGKWRLNEGESHFPAGLKKRWHNVILNVERDDGRILQYTSSGTQADGTPRSYHLDSNWASVLRQASDGSQFTFTHHGSREFEFNRVLAAEDEGGRDAICRFSADGAHFTCEWECRYGAVREVYDRND